MRKVFSLVYVATVATAIVVNAAVVGIAMLPLLYEVIHKDRKQGIAP
jgi:hypothetical protein